MCPKKSLVALRFDLEAAVRREVTTDERVVVVQKLQPSFVAEFLGEDGGAFDIREHDRDRAVRRSHCAEVRAVRDDGLRNAVHYRPPQPRRWLSVLFTQPGESFHLDGHAVAPCHRKPLVDQTHRLFPIARRRSVEKCPGVLVADPGRHVFATDLDIACEREFEVFYRVLVTARGRGGEAEEGVVGAEAPGSGEEQRAAIGVGLEHLVEGACSFSITDGDRRHRKHAHRCQPVAGASACSEILFAIANSAS